MNYVMRQGKRIEVITHDFGIAPKKRRKSFRAVWVKVPRNWITSLRRSRSVRTYELALMILMAAYERQTDTITLSGETTSWMSREKRRRAAWELAELGLIRVEGGGHKALKVVILNYHALGLLPRR